MKKMTCVILGLAFLALGILGISGLGTMFQSNPVYLNIAEIILGGLGLLVGVYARQVSPQKLVSSQQVNDIDRQRQDIDQQRKDIDQQRIEFEQQKKDYKEKPDANRAS